MLFNPAAVPDAARANEMLALVGKNPSMILGTRNCRETCAELQARGVPILAEPRDMPYGVEAVLADLYGNAYVLVEPRQGSDGSTYK